MIPRVWSNDLIHGVQAISEKPGASAWLPTSCSVVVNGLERDAAFHAVQVSDMYLTLSDMYIIYI